MTHRNVEKRACRRFEIPGAKVSIRKAGLLGRLSGFSEPFEMANLSKGGVGFETSIAFKANQKVLVKLDIEGNAPLLLWGLVRWQAKFGTNRVHMTGIQFLPFGRAERANPPEALEVLSRLEETCLGKDEKPFTPGASERKEVTVNIDELF